MPSAPALNLSEMGMSTRASTGVTSFGSKYWVFPEDRDLAARLAQCDLQNGFRRVVVDPATGFVSLMAPCRAQKLHPEAKPPIDRPDVACREPVRCEFLFWPALRR